MIENKYIFFFESDRHIIIETKRTDLDKDARREDVYFWLMIDKISKDCKRLHFLSMTKEPEQIRQFKEGTLFFNDKKAVFRDENFINKAISEISHDVDSWVKHFIVNV